MHYMPEIRRTIMIDKKFWERIAENWSKDDDGIVVPPIEPPIITEIDFNDDISNDEINDILDELGLGDI